MSNYDQLAAFAKAHRDNPLEVVKVLVAWEFTSLLPQGAGAQPTTPKSVAEVLNGSCGWRDYLLSQVLAEIGIQTRRVNFHDVPFQTNHTATEVNIGGKWMFFDGSFGTYFERPGGGAPLSIAEARAAWPNVVIKQCVLPGLQGVFVDPNTISASAYAPVTGNFAMTPENYAGATDIAQGEWNSLYFGPRASYYVNFKSIAVPTPGHTYTTRVDANDSKAWNRIIDSIDSQRGLDARTVENDDRSKQFIDWDVHGRRNWQQLTTVYSAHNALQSELTIFDDGSRQLLQGDFKRSEDWSSIDRIWTASKLLASKKTVYDDGTTINAEWDIYGVYDWSSRQDAFDASGQVVSSVVTLDDGTIVTVDWALAALQNGGAGADQVAGTNASDVLVGNEGDDWLGGGGGQDFLAGGTGNDTYVSDGSDLIRELANEGIDVVISATNYVLGANLENLVLEGAAVNGSGNELNNIIVGNALDNVLTGQAGNDRLRGEMGWDYLYGSAGDDILEGGEGRDVMFGGAGRDTFIWRAISETSPSLIEADIVKDFSAAAGEKLSLRLMDANEVQAGNQAFEFVGTAGFSAAGQVRYVHKTSETWILLNTDADASADGMIRLPGRANLDASWFDL